MLSYVFISALLAAPAEAENGGEPEREQSVSELADKSLAELLMVPVVQTAVRYDQSPGDAPVKMVVWSQQQIYDNGFQTLDEVLEHTPGFFWAFSSPFNSYSVRGMSPVGLGLPQPYILYMVNGIRLNETTYYGHYYNYFHNMDNVERIEIVFGPGGALYGLNAISAVVNIITKAPSLTEARTTVTASQYVSSPLNTATPFGAVEWSNGNGAGVYGSVFVPSLTSGNWNTGNSQLGTVNWYQNSPWHHGLAKSGKYVPDWDLSARYGRFGIFTYRTSVEYSNFDAPNYDITAPRPRSFERRIFDVAYYAPFWDSEFHLDFNEHFDFASTDGGVDLRAPAPVPGSNSHFNTSVAEYLGNFQLSPIHTEKNHLLVGGDYSYSSRQTDRRGDLLSLSVDQHRYSAFSQLENRLIPNTILTAGLRFDALTLYPKDTAQRNALLTDSATTWSPRLSAQYRFNEDNRLRASYARANRQYIPVDLIVPDSAHTSDYTDDYELGYDWRMRHNLEWDFNLFYMKAPHFSGIDIAPVSKFLSYGFESDVVWKLSRFEFRLGASYAHASDDVLEQNGLDQMLYVPRALIRANVRAPVLNNVLNVAVLATGNIDILYADNSTGDNKYSYSYCPIDVVFTSDKKLRPLYFGFGIRNLFNNPYRYPGIGTAGSFQPWNFPTYLVSSSSMENPGLTTFVKLGVQYTL